MTDTAIGLDPGRDSLVLWRQVGYVAEMEQAA